MDIHDTPNKYQDRHGQRLSSKNIKEAVLHVTEQQEEEIERNINNLHAILHFSLQLLRICKRKMKMGH